MCDRSPNTQVAYVDFLGFRVLAQSVLPIINSHDFSSTLLLGSPDGGQSFTDLVGRIDPDTHDAYRVLGKEDSTLDGDPETRGRLQALGEQLGLAPHSVGALGFRLQQKRTKSKKKKVQEFEWVLHERKYTVYLGANVQVRHNVYLLFLLLFWLHHIVSNYNRKKFALVHERSLVAPGYVCTHSTQSLIQNNRFYIAMQ